MKSLSLSNIKMKYSESWIITVQNDHRTHFFWTLYVFPQDSTMKCGMSVLACKYKNNWCKFGSLNIQPFHIYNQNKKKLTRILYPPCLCELCVRRNGFPLSNRHIFHKRHWRRVDIWTLKVIICTNSCLKVPNKAQIQHGRFNHNLTTKSKTTCV